MAGLAADRGRRDGLVRLMNRNKNRWPGFAALSRALGSLWGRRRRVSAFGQFWRYVLSGLASAAVHYAILIALVESGFPVLASSCAGATAGMIASYLLNYHFTFRSDEPHHAALSKFLAVTAGGWLINAVAMWILVHTVHLHYLVLQTVALAMVIAFNFSGFRWFAFRAHT